MHDPNVIPLHRCAWVYHAWYRIRGRFRCPRCGEIFQNVIPRRRDS
jgi:hypothetical protein